MDLCVNCRTLQCAYRFGTIGSWIFPFFLSFFSLKNSWRSIDNLTFQTLYTGARGDMGYRTFTMCISLSSPSKFNESFSDKPWKVLGWENVKWKKPLIFHLNCFIVCDDAPRDVFMGGSWQKNALKLLSSDFSKSRRRRGFSKSYSVA